MLKTTQLLKHLQGLTKNPRSELGEISREYYSGGFTILTRFYSIFFILIPVSYLLRELTRYKTFKVFIFNSFILPWIALLAYVAVLYLLSIILEEVSQVLKGKVTYLSGAKSAYFSGIPLLTMLLFSTIPYVGFLFAFSGFIYQIIVLYISADVLFEVPSNRRFLWMVAIILSFLLLLLLFALLASLSSLALNFIQL